MLIAPEDIEWDDSNSEHATRHGVTIDEVTQALLNGPSVHRNRKGRAGPLCRRGDRRRSQNRRGRRMGHGPERCPPYHGVGAAMTDDVNRMTEAELADHYYAQRNDPDATGEQVDYRPPRGARVGVRLSFDEERRIRESAELAGMTVSAYLRQAGLAAAAERVVDLDRLRRDVDEARARIDDAWRALA